MATGYVAVTVVTIVANALVAGADLVGATFVRANSASVGVPASWLTPLGLLKAAGAIGLLLGLLGVPLIGTAAATGLVLFFVGAILTHVRAKALWPSVGAPVCFLLLAVGSLVLGLMAG